MKKLAVLIATLAASTMSYADETMPGARWWWLGSALDTANVRWNMEQYASHGIGALEITPLYGVQGNAANNIDYLSPKWMEMLKYVENEGQRLGIQIDMNNGTGWPFGGPATPLSEAAAKVIVVDSTVNSAVLKSATLKLTVPEKEKKSSQLDFVMAYPSNVKGYKGGVIDVTAFVDPQTGTVKWKTPKKGDWRLIAIYVGRTRQQVKRAAPGGQGYVIDHFDKQAVAHYLEIFDKAFEATSTPWPHSMFNDSYEVYGADWTPTLPQEFAQRRGYSLKENINKLVDRDKKVVSDYRETLSDMLLENFTNQWTAWAHSHGMTVRNQAHGSPANLIDIYAAVDIPEIEGFGLSEFGIKGLRVDPGMTKINDSDYSMLKYAPSAAHITGKKLVSSETFTWLTEHFRTSLSQMKPDLDLMFCAGVNHMYFHGTCYSPQNDPWPGWKFYASVDMSPTNSIWRDAPELMRYIQRCQALLQQGQPDNDILVYFPIRNLWQDRTKTLLMQFAIHNLGELAPEFKNAILQLDRLGYDCDYISDKYLLTSTSTADGKIQTAAGTQYKALMIPTGAILADDVQAHVKALQAKGVKVIEGNDSEALAAVAVPEEIKTHMGLKMIRRKVGNGYVYFIANLTPNDVDEYAQLAIGQQPMKWYDPLTDRYFATEQSAQGVRITLRSGESRFLTTADTTADSTLPTLKTAEVSGTSIDIDSGWKLSFTEEQPKVEGTFDIDKLTTWETLDNDSAKVTMGTGVYETTFTIPMTDSEAKKLSEAKRKAKRNTVVRMLARGTWAIDLGDVRESARVYINDQYIGTAWCVPYVLNISEGILQKGENRIRIEVTNLPANRIADLDRKGVKWRKFEEINVVDIKYRKTTYDNWTPVPSGLNSTVRIYKTE